jgi:hypothetical protein
LNNSRNWGEFGAVVEWCSACDKAIIAHFWWQAWQEMCDRINYKKSSYVHGTAV